MSVPITMQVPTDFITDADVGSEDRGDEARAELEALLAEGEAVVIATAGKAGCALFTDRRIIVRSQAGVFTKRPVVHFIRGGAIDGATIDASDSVVLRLVGRGFGGATFAFDSATDPARLARWCADAMSQAS